MTHTRSSRHDRPDIGPASRPRPLHAQITRLCRPRMTAPGNTGPRHNGGYRLPRRRGRITECDGKTVVPDAWPGRRIIRFVRAEMMAYARTPCHWQSWIG